jgi:hypothetical protein
MSRNVIRKVGSFVLSLTAGCGLFGGEDDPSISLTASSTAVVLQQAATSPVTLDIARTNFEKPVTLALEGTLPTGVTATFTQNPVAAGNTTTTLNIAAGGAATPGTAALTIKATGEGITEKAVLIDITVNVRGSHTVALTNNSMTVAQGGGGQSTVLVARQNSNAGSVTLAATGAPAGMTVSFGESPTTSTATSVTVAATGSVAPGSYNVSISGTQPGVTNPAAATLAVTVIAAPATASMTIPFCANDMPTWFAYQNDGFLWQRVTPSGNAFTFSATDKLGIAFVFQSGNASDVRFYMASRAELAGLTDRDCGTKTHPGTTTNLAAGQTGAVSLGPTFEVVSGNAYLLEGVPDRSLDLSATRGTVSGPAFTPDRMVIRRSINLANNASFPVIDFTGAESFAPASNTLSIAGLEASETVYTENDFYGNGSTSGVVYAAQGTSNIQTMYSVPAASLVAGDVSGLYIDAFNASNTVAHSMISHFDAPGDRVETLGPLLTVPTVSVASSAPYVRERGQLSSQSAYNTAARFVFLQGSSPNTKFVVVVVTAAYLGSVPATWDLIVPDLASVTGFSAAWMHTAGLSTPYSAEAFSGRASVLFGGLPDVGETIKFAFRQSTVATSVGSALRAGAAERRAAFDQRRGILDPPPQYLRR